MGRAAATRIPDKLYFRIGEVSDITGVQPHVLRYWESEFDLVAPQKSKSNQRLYRKKDVELILEIKRLLYDEKFTIAGARLRLSQRAGREAPRPKPVAVESGQGQLPFADARLRGELRAVKEELERILALLE